MCSIWGGISGLPSAPGSLLPIIAPRMIQSHASVPELNCHLPLKT
jgi:hypothetical protein